MAAERWIRENPQAEVERVVCDDARIRRLVGRDFPEAGLADSVLIKAGQVTGVDILRHYDREPPVEPTLEPPDDKSIRRHFHRLLRQAETLRSQLQVPTSMEVFSLETCNTVVSSELSGATPWSERSWGSCFGTPLQWRQTVDQNEPIVEVRLPMESEDIFSYLRDHLSAESPDITEILGEWRETISEWLQLCLEQISQTVAACQERTGLDYVGGGRLEGLYPTAPAYVCRYALNPPDPPDMPRLDRIRREDTWWLVPPELPAWGLAQGSADALDQLSLILTEVIADTARQPVWARIHELSSDLERQTARLRSQLTVVIERGDVKGTCRACPGQTP